MRHIILICFLLFTTTAFAGSDIVATYEYSDGSMVTIVTRDSQHVRMDTSPTSYMLLKENKIYSVVQDDKGQWMVVDMDQMKGVASGGFMSLFGGGEPAPEKTYSARYEKTGTKEKIAGYTGYVYNIEVKENNELVRRDEVVLCTHSDLKKVNQGWTAIGAKMSDIMGEEMSKSLEQATSQALESGYGGMLRYGEELKLKNLKKMSLSASVYELPDNSQTVQMAPSGNVPVSPQQPEASVPEPSNAPENQTGQTESELATDANDVGQAARDEAKDTTEDEVRDSVKSLIKGLFD